MAPERIGSWIIGRKLGAGGMGKVYHAIHCDTGQEAAVKVLPASLAREEGFVARFDREIDSLNRLHNQWTVELYDHGVDDETYYYSMEYVEGETLTKRLLREKRIPWREAIDISLEICSALKAAHDAGIIHRDLKPSNLMLTPDGHIKLTDFGVAQLFAAEKLTVTGGIIGTAEYMSPEQAQGQRATKKSDLYSLGAVLYAMVTGRPPFSGKTSIDVIQMHKFGQFDKPRLFAPEIPHWLEEIICKLLEKNPDDRFPDAYVLSLRLKEIVKKVELSQSTDRTLAMPGGIADATEPTILAEPRASGPGAGTLMQSLFRAQYEADQKQTFFGQLLENTWVHVALLILIVVGGVFWFRSNELSPDEMYARGVALLESDSPSDWRTARDDYFVPLVESDPKIWAEKVRPQLETIDARELRTSLAPKRIGRDAVPESEPERLLLTAQKYREAGQYQQAEQTLAAVLDMLAGETQYDSIKQVAFELLTELRSEETYRADRKKFVSESMDRAAELAANGNLLDSRRIWSGIVSLYGNDPDLQKYVGQAKEHLEQEAVAKE